MDAAGAAAAQQLFDEGRLLVTEGDASAACPKFEESHRLDPRTGTKFNLADCYERIGRTASAWTLFLEVAGESKVARRFDRENVARARAEALAPRLSRLAVMVPMASREAGLTVERGGVSVGQAQWGSAVPVDRGEHTVSARAPGRKVWQTTVSIPDGAASIVVTVPLLPPLASPAGPTRADVEEGHQRSLSLQRVTALGLGGAGVVLLGIGGYFGFRAMSEASASESGCDGGRCENPGSLEHYEDARSAGTLATVFLSAGGVLAAGGAVLYLTEPPRSDGRDAFRAPVIRVGVSTEGLVAGGTW